GAQYPDRRERPVLARPECFLRGRRLHFGDPDGTCRNELRPDTTDRWHHLLCFRISVRAAGAALERRLSGARNLCLGDRDAAASEARLFRAMDRRRARPCRDQAGPAGGGAEHALVAAPEDVAGYVALLLHASDHHCDLHLLG